MKSSFDDIRLTWNGQTFVIPSDRVLGAIARVEDVITFHELLAYSGRSTAPVGKLAEAYGILLRYAGADVTDDAVYVGMFGNLTEGFGGTVRESIETLMLMMIPKDERQKGKPEPAAGKPQGSRPIKSTVKTARSPAKKVSSKPRGRRSSARAD